ncbi:hypothetical protein HDU83_001071 [Entophlyctis luteolus]|nr:hypothetical protein HDU83_001071 [Entophlyctis luteolus]
MQVFSLNVYQPDTFVQIAEVDIFAFRRGPISPKVEDLENHCKPIVSHPKFLMELCLDYSGIQKRGFELFAATNLPFYVKSNEITSSFVYAAHRKVCIPLGYGNALERYQTLLRKQMFLRSAEWMCQSMGIFMDEYVDLVEYCFSESELEQSKAFINYTCVTFQKTREVCDKVDVFEMSERWSSAVAPPRITNDDNTAGIRIEVDFRIDSERNDAARPLTASAVYSVFFNNSLVGVCELVQPLHHAEDKIYTARILLSPMRESDDAVAAAELLVSEFGSGKTVEIVLKLADEEGVSLRVAIPSEEIHIVECITALLPPNLWRMTVQGTITLNNPFDCEIYVRRIQGDCLFGGNTVSCVDATFKEDEMHLGPRQTRVESPIIQVTLRLDMGTVYMLMGMMTSAG